MSLPPGWVQATLGEVAETQLGKMLDQRKTEGRKLPYLRNINVRWGSIETSDLLFMPFKEAEIERFGIRPGDVLICEGGEPGRSAVWAGGETDIKFQKALHRVRVGEALAPNWLVHLLSFDAYRGILEKQFTGTTIKHLTREAIQEYRVLLAPQPEQKRILEALDSYLTRLDAAEQALHRAQANLKRYRASVLKAAVEGRLVPTEAELARKEGRAYEPASVLLARILAERKLRWEKAERAKMKAKGIVPKDDRWKAKYEEPIAPDLSGMPELPEGWCWATVDQVAEVGTGATPKRGETRYYKGGTIPWVTSAAVNERLVHETAEFVTPAALNETNLDVYPPGTLILAMYGEGKTRGKVAELAIAATTNQALAAVVLSESAEAVRPWVSLFLEHNYEAIRRLSSGGVQPNLNLGIVRGIRFPLAPLVKQSSVVKEVEKALSETESALATVVGSLARIARLRQAILKWAFEGKLVDQDPNDEPAAELLARIRAAREKSAAQTANSRRAPRRPRPPKKSRA